MQTQEAERRSSTRVPFQQPAVVEVRQRGRQPDSYPALVVNMSSKGILFDCEHKLPVGKRVEVLIKWPVELDDSCALKLCVVGRVQRRDKYRTAISVEKQEFRTAGRTFADHPAA